MKNYKISWRFKISAIDELPEKNKKYIIKKWGNFMNLVMSKSKTPMQCSDLTEIRKIIIDKGFSVESLYSDMMENNPQLFRLFVDISDLFNRLPIDLQAYILLTFNFNSYDLKKSLEKTT